MNLKVKKQKAELLMSKVKVQSSK